MKTYTITNDSGEESVEANSAAEALAKAIRMTRRGDWEPEDSDQETVRQLVKVVNDDDPDDEASENAIMWP